MSAPFQRWLRERLGPKTRFEPFDWSGANSHRKRRKAGSELGEKIRKLAEDPNKTGRLYLVAHSHGGNVALYAQAKPEIARRVSGVVCLGTPFLWCHPRNLEIPRYVCHALFWPFVHYGPLVLAIVIGWNFENFWLSFLLIVGALCLKFFTTFDEWMMNKVIAPVRWLEETLLEWGQQRVMDCVAPPPVEAPVFCANAEVDEAATYLRVLERAGNAVSRWGPAFFMLRPCRFSWWSPSACSCTRGSSGSAWFTSRRWGS